MQINFARREIACKIVYYGPGMSGKTTNLEVLHAKTPKENKGELTCIATEGDRTLFFDFMPLNLGNIRGMNTKFQLYTVPGQVYYNSTRKLVLRGVDGVIFVADSSPDKMDENIESLRNLEDNLRDYGRDIDSVSIIIQYNKRDRPDAVDVKILNDKINKRGYPWFEAVATDGTGVFDSLKSLAGQVIQKLELHSAGIEGADKNGATGSPDRGHVAPRASAPSANPAASRSGSSAPTGRTAAASTPKPARQEAARPAASSSPRKSAPATRRPAASARPQPGATTKAPGGRQASGGVATKAAPKTAPKTATRPAKARTQPVRRTTKTSAPAAKSSSSWVMPTMIVVAVLAAAGAAWKFFL